MTAIKMSFLNLSGRFKTFVADETYENTLDGARSFLELSHPAVSSSATMLRKPKSIIGLFELIGSGAIDDRANNETSRLALENLTAALGTRDYLEYYKQLAASPTSPDREPLSRSSSASADFEPSNTLVQEGIVNNGSAETKNDEPAAGEAPTT